MEATAKYKDGKFVVETCGVEMEFSYDDLQDKVKQARDRNHNQSWWETLCSVARSLASNLYAFIKGDIDLILLGDALLACLLAMFNRFVDACIDATMCFVEAGVAQVKRFFDWLFRKFI